MPETITDLGKKVKAKYPGQYDDLSDTEVGKRVKAKYPEAYDDFTDAAPAQVVPQSPVTSADTPGGALRNIVASGAEMLGFEPTIPGSIKGVGRTLATFAHPITMLGQGSQIEHGDQINPLSDIQSLYHATAGRILGGAATKDPYEISGGIGASLPFVPAVTGGIAAAEDVARRTGMPDSLMVRAANNRVPRGNSLGASDVIAAGIGAASHGTSGAITAEAVNMFRKVLGNPYRTGKANLQENLARFLSRNDRAPQVPNTPQLYQGQPGAAPSAPAMRAVGRTETAGRPAEAGGSTRPMPPRENIPPADLAERGPFPGETPESVNVPRPQSTYQPPPEEPGPFFNNMRQSTAADEIPMREGVTTEAVASRMSKVDPVTRVEQGIAPSGEERAALALRVAPKLANDPVLSSLPPGAAWDNAAFHNFKAAEAELKAAGQSVPKGTTVPLEPVLDDILTLIDEQSSFKAHPDLVANSAANRVLGDWYNKLSKLKEVSPNVLFDELRDFRQQLDREVGTHGGYKQTASSAERAEMIASRDVVGVIRKHLKGISERLDAADAAYGPAADTVTAAGLDWNTGRRLSTVGDIPKPPKTPRITPENIRQRLRGGPL